MNKATKIYIAGHLGMVGSAVWRALESKGYTNLIGKTFEDLDLKFSKSILDYIKITSSSKNITERPDDEIHSLKRNSADNINNWMNRLTKEEIALIKEKTFLLYNILLQKMNS